MLGLPDIIQVPTVMRMAWLRMCWLPAPLRVTAGHVVVTRMLLLAHFLEPQGGGARLLSQAFSILALNTRVGRRRL